jgi:dTDP-4-amino-4,6-dideoxygalactose transaminase
VSDRVGRQQLPISRPWLGAEESEAVRRVLATGWVSQGPEVEAFEVEFAQYVGARHGCATSSGSAALRLALEAVGVEQGDEVVTVSYSFVATAHAIRLCGAVPRFVDIDPARGTMDPELVESHLGERTRAILCVHQIGLPCDVERLAAIAGRHGIALVEDAACAVGSEVEIQGAWERIGKPHGDIACFSFHPRKILTTGEGGMVTTNDDQLDALCRRRRQHAMVPAAADGGPPRMEIVEVGHNFRMSDLQAAVGRVQLARLPEVLERRRHQADRYRRLLEDRCRLTPPAEPAGVRTNWQSYYLRLPQDVDAAAVRTSMLKEGVATLGGIMCCHRQPAYQQEPWSCGLRRGQDCDCPAGSCTRLRYSEEAEDHGVILPLYHELTASDQEAVIDALARALPTRSA